MPKQSPKARKHRAAKPHVIWQRVEDNAFHLSQFFAVFGRD
jgi:hypothetical protein